MRPELTPYDVAWALDVIIFKIDLQDAGVVYGIDLVVIDGQGEEIANGPSIDNGDEPIDLSKSNVIAVSAQMEGQILRGKCNMFGFSTKYQFEGIFFENDGIGWNLFPARDGDMYWLLAKDSPIMGFGNCPFAEGSTKLAVKLLRTPRRENTIRAADRQ
jgi:hypothetical protein